MVEMLALAGLRATRQRLALVSLLFSKGDRHFTADMLCKEAQDNRIDVSVATVYNTINRLTHAGLLTQITIDGSRSYYDTNVSGHHHFYVEGDQALIDISDANLDLVRMPKVPDDYEISRVEVVVRLRKIAA